MSAGTGADRMTRRRDIFQGLGSHESEVVNAYLSAVTGFLQSFPEKPDVVDLGCGDFAVGSRIRPYCGRYVAADFVEGLIERNKQVYESDNVDFRALDMINDDLPTGDVVFIRQVLQHLSNGEIQKVVAKLPGSYRSRFSPSICLRRAVLWRTWIKRAGHTSG